MKGKKRLYLAYGSNLNVRQMRRRCPGAKIAGRGVISDYRLMYKGSKTGSYLTIEREKGKKVPVGVWEVTADDERRLDVYEGYPSFYYKRDIKTTLVDKKTGEQIEVNAFVYIMHEERRVGIPIDYYVDVCMEGYEDFGFDKDILREAYDYSVDHVGERKKRKAS